MKVNAIAIRPGHVVEHNGKLWTVLKSEIFQPGKGAAIVNVEMRDAKTGVKTVERFRTQEVIEKVQLDENEYQFLYIDGDNAAFMNNENYEQISVSLELIGEPARFLQDGMVCNIRLYEGSPLSVQLPDHVVMEIVEADPVVKGQTASSSYKPAKLENGAKILVPPFIESGEKVVVRTDDGSYVERAK